MQRGRKKPTIAKQVADDDLEPYRQLIKIQKQLVEMAEQHEQTKRECDALRERVASELLALHENPGVHRRLRQSAARLFQRLSRRAAKPLPPPLDSHNQTFPC